MASLGKIAPAEFERVVAPRLGATRPEVLVGPGVGRDSAIIRIGAGRVLAVTTDPLSLVPALGSAESARLSCHLLASDVWATGIPPAYASVCFSLPPEFAADEFERYWQAMSDEFAALGVAVVTGHTGRYPGCAPSIIGAATLMGIGDEGRTVGPDWVRPGDRVIMTKDSALEATAIAARLFPKRLAGRLDEDQLARARALGAQVSVVADCRAALRVGVRDGGVSALHDATEGGVLGALLELARASGMDFRITRAAMLVSVEAQTACELMGLDPLWTLSEGTLVLTARPAHARAVLAALADEGIAAADIGEALKGNGVVWLTATDGTVAKLTEPEPDGYWAAYDRAVREGWT